MIVMYTSNYQHYIESLVKQKPPLSNVVTSLPMTLPLIISVYMYIFHHSYCQFLSIRLNVIIVCTFKRIEQWRPSVYQHPPPQTYIHYPLHILYSLGVYLQCGRHRTVHRTYYYCRRTGTEYATSKDLFSRNIH